MTGSMIAVWQGPFPDPGVMAPERPSYGAHAKLLAGASMTVLTTTASSMDLADPTWWSFH
jgi:hypothetical protein